MLGVLRGAAGAGAPRARGRAGALGATAAERAAEPDRRAAQGRGPGVIAEHYDAVSVLFADIVGFTDAVGRHGAPTSWWPCWTRSSPRSTGSPTRRASRRSRRSATRTWWPAGCPSRGPTTWRRSPGRRSRCARRSRRSPSGTGHGWLAVRIGIDAGPAVAGVIGRRKFIYDLWGDTVNTASRMESHGLPGEIQVTERVAAALGPAFALRPRGTIEVKGKGPMATYLLDRVEPRVKPRTPSQAPSHHRRRLRLRRDRSSRPTSDGDRSWRPPSAKSEAESRSFRRPSRSLQRLLRGHGEGEQQGHPERHQEHHPRGPPCTARQAISASRVRTVAKTQSPMMSSVSMSLPEMADRPIVPRGPSLRARFTRARVHRPRPCHWERTGRDGRGEAGGSPRGSALRELAARSGDGRSGRGRRGWRTPAPPSSSGPANRPTSRRPRARRCRYTAYTWSVPGGVARSIERRAATIASPGLAASIRSRQFPPCSVPALQHHVVSRHGLRVPPASAEQPQERRESPRRRAAPQIDVARYSSSQGAVSSILA